MFGCAHFGSSMKRVLIVEDDELTARSLMRLLRLAGFDVVRVGSCKKARASSESFALGVFDVDLPDGSGVELACELLSEERVRAVVFYSASSDESTLTAARRIGNVVTKGARRTDLLRAIRHAHPPNTESPPALERESQEKVS
jgi:DNA-binding response OmpR family regulator